MSYLITTSVHYTKTYKSKSIENSCTNDKCGRTCYNEAGSTIQKTEFIAFYKSKYLKYYSLKI